MCSQPELLQGVTKLEGPEGQASLASSTLFTSPHQEGLPAATSSASLPRREPSVGRRPHQEHTVRLSAALSVPLSGSQPSALCIPQPRHFL